jgi:two-component system sensor histidine kinase AtoS
MPNNEPPPAGESSGNERNLGHLLRQTLAAGVIVIDSEGQVRAANPRAIEILGLPGIDIGQEVLPQEVRVIVEQSISSGADSNNDQVLIKRPGSPGRVVRVSTVFLSQGKNTRLIAILTDVTGVDELEAHVHRLHRVASVGTSAAGMAHEIKNALVAVRTFIDLLIEKHPGNEMAEMASREVRRINSLASQMLKLAGPSKVTLEPVHLHDVLEHALGLVQVQLTEKHITLVRQLRARNAEVQGDAYQLEQAFVNLFLNAIEAMSEGGKLSACTDYFPPETANQVYPTRELQQHPLVSLTVSDTGTGIPPENLERLFDTFFTTKASGTGLGLTITRRIIREHKGEIQVYSQLGKGTTFTILLPVLGNLSR